MKKLNFARFLKFFVCILYAFLKNYLIRVHFSDKNFLFFSKISSQEKFFSEKIHLTKISHIFFI